MPPGCYLSAIEILRRQYVAHLADLAARGQLPGVLPMPRRASALFGESGWLRRLVAAATGDTGRRRPARRAASSTCSPGHVDDAAREELREFAERGLKAKADEAEDTWHRRLEDLRDRLAAIDKAMGELIESDPVQRGYKRELAGERRGVARRIGEIGRTDAHGALVDLGLLPNYSLIDVSTTLEATLTWQEDDEDGGQAVPQRTARVPPPGQPGADRAGARQPLLHPRLPARRLRPRHRHQGPAGVGALAGLPAVRVRPRGPRRPGHQPLPALRQPADRRRQRAAQGAPARPRHLARPARRRPDRRR